MRIRFAFAGLLVLGAAFAGFAAGLEFMVANDRTNLLYKVGEEASFTVTAVTDGVAVAEGCVDVTLDNFGPSVQLSKRVDFAQGNPFTVRGKLDEPGFLRLTLNSKGAKARVWGVGYEPELIEKGSPSPDDFDAFWANARAKLAKEVSA